VERTLFFDLECDTGVRRGDGIHIPIIAGFADCQGRYYSFVGEDCVEKMLLKMTDVVSRDELIVAFAHNLKYDFSLIVDSVKYVSSYIEKGGRLYGARCSFNNRNITFRDSLKLIDTKLSNFNKMFDLPSGKMECMPYDFYTIDNIKDESCSILEFVEYLKPSHKISDESTKFYELINSDSDVMDCVLDNDRFDHVKYYLLYHKQDCQVLRDGLFKYREEVSCFVQDTRDMELDILKLWTIPSFAHRYYQDCGCYDGLFQFGGTLLNCVMEATAGGRVMYNIKYFCKVVNENITDLDVNSLYPSAMWSVPNGGFPKGPAVRYHVDPDQTLDTSWEIFQKLTENVFYYLVKVQVLQINKFQQLPIVSQLVDNKRRFYNKDEGPLPRSSWIGKITLEDWVEFCDIDFIIEDVLYFDSGANGNFVSTVESLLEKRKEYKRRKSPLQKNAKDIMNSAYGKSIETIRHEESHILRTTDGKRLGETEDVSELCESDKKFVNYFPLIKEHKSIGSKFDFIRIAQWDSSMRPAQVGVITMEMSKRIMNRVMNVCEDVGAVVYYTDTDSLHIRLSDVEKVRIEYKLRYPNLKLFGDDLCQFHEDFDDPNPEIKCCMIGKRPISKQMIILGAKSYCHKLY